ncbi:MAG: helicase-exonuclease AddAB subunit AddA, partial [Firmicutes bacterium]|nr:helicase-exonuclease AddAB subunit AddA [Bacillota bacterium]
MPEWTTEQWEAITARGSNLLVSAAAGAGKTAVVVERILRILADPQGAASLENLLVVTFTEAAAEEMRGRVGRALEELVKGLDPEDPARSEFFRRQLLLLNRANISTLHSFCLKILRTYFYQVGLDPGFRVAAEAETELMQEEILDRVLEEGFAAEPEGGPVTELADALGGRGDETLAALILRVYEYSQSQPWPLAWLMGREGDYANAALGQAGLSQLAWFPDLLDMLQTSLQEARLWLERAARLAARPGGPAAYLDNLRQEADRIRELSRRLTFLAGSRRPGDISWEELREIVEKADYFPRLKGTNSSEVREDLKNKVRKLREQAKRQISDLKSKLFDRTETEELADLIRTGQMVGTLTGLVRHFAESYTAEKRRRGLVDFNDLEHLALRVLLDGGAEPGQLSPSPVALELRRQFAEVIVDEYQDINRVQEAILTLVSRQGPDNTTPPNLFLVGDMKQSIYRFRQAEPGLFKEKERCYGAEPGPAGRLIRLSHNFRSRPGVVAAVNYLFRQLFSERVGELTYDREAELVYQAGYREHWRAAPPAVELYLLEHQEPAEALSKDDFSTKAESADPLNENLPEEGETKDQEGPEDLSSLEREARFAARRIKEMVEGTPDRHGPEFDVWDKDGQSYRPLSYRDVVILLRATRGRANVFLEALNQAGVPAYADLGTGYFAALEVETILSLLRVIDNPHQDIPLATVLHSPLVGLTTEDLVRIRLASPRGDFFSALRRAARGKGPGLPLLPPMTPEGQANLTPRLVQFLSQVTAWRTAARRRPLGDLIWQIYRETGYLEYVGGLPGGAQRQANLRALLYRGRQFESFVRHGLFRFLRFIDRLRQSEGDLGTARALGENENVVRVMSVHKAKGLEFPVVVLAGLGKKFNRQDLLADVLLHPKLGLVARRIDTERGVKYPTLAYRAAAHRIGLEALSEELRILYVALTRAREKLILLGSPGNLSKKAEEWAAALTFLPPEEESTCLYQAESGRGGKANADRPVSASDRPNRRLEGSSDLRGGPLPDLLLARARSPLDWIGPALIRHRDGESLRRLVDLARSPSGEAFPARLVLEQTLWATANAREEGPGTSPATVGPSSPVDRPGEGSLSTLVIGPSIREEGSREEQATAALFRGDEAATSEKDLGPNDSALSRGDGANPSEKELGVIDSDPSSWHIVLVPSSTVGPGPAATSAVPEFLERVRQLQPPLEPPDTHLQTEVVRRLNWRDPLAPLSGKAVKLGVTELKRRPDVFGEESAGERSGYFRTGISQRPAFLQERRGLSPAERGIIIHLVLQHVDLTQPVTGEAVRALLADLVGRDVLTPEQAGAVEAERIAGFFATPLGQRLLVRPERVRREIAFSLGLPAGEVYPELASLGPTLSGEKVLVQGIIDCLVEEEDGLVLLDFKTGKPPLAAEPAGSRERKSGAS